MEDGQANVPVGLEKADEVPARLHSTAGVVLGGPLDLVGRERMPAVALAGNSDRRLSASPPGDGRSWEASSGGWGPAVNGCQRQLLGAAVRGGSAALLVLDERNDPLRARVPQNAVQRAENLA